MILFTVQIDTREQKPLPLPHNMRVLHPMKLPWERDSVHVILKQEETALPTGDYRLAPPFHRKTIVERKGRLDEVAENCLTRVGRKRFSACCRRLRNECERPVLLLEGTTSDLLQKSHLDYDPWLAVDALQRICFEHRIMLIHLPASTPRQRLVVGEELVRLLVNSALTTEIPVPEETDPC